MTTTKNQTINSLPDHYVLISSWAYYNYGQCFTATFTVADFRSYFPYEYHGADIEEARKLIREHVPYK